MDSLEFECIDPELGKQMYKLESGDIDPALQHQLLQHLRLCHACGEIRHLESIVSERLRDGSTLDLAKTPQKRLRAVVSAPVIRVLALAAMLATLILGYGLPPRDDSRQIVREMEPEPGTELSILRPVEGEVISGRGPDLEWTPIKGATRYSIAITELEGDQIWSEMVEAPETGIGLPEEIRVQGDYLGQVRSLPTGLTTEPVTSVAFSRRGLLPFLVYRLTHLPAIVMFTGILAVILIVLPTVIRRLDS